MTNIDIFAGFKYSSKFLEMRSLDKHTEDTPGLLLTPPCTPDLSGFSLWKKFRNFAPVMKHGANRRKLTALLEIVGLGGVLTSTEFDDGGSIHKGDWFDSDCRVRLRARGAGHSYPCEAFLRGKVDDHVVKHLRAEIQADVLAQQPAAG